jgi:hypothetical protein
MSKVMQYHFIDGDECRDRCLPILRIVLFHIIVDQHLIIDFASGHGLPLQDRYVGGLLEVGESTHDLHSTSIRLQRQV